MLIFIDTNIFFHHWQLRNPDFTYLFNFIENENCKLLLSEIVVSEIESNREGELNASISSVRKNLKNIDNWCESPTKIDLTAAYKPYSFKNILLHKLDKEYIDYIDYAHISQTEMVERAIKRTRPFRESEKGFRDTLIWLSFLDYLSDNNTQGEVAFITANVDDFQNSKRTAFHDDLLEDIQSRDLKCEVKFYNSLFTFIASTFNKEDHVLSHYELNKIEDEIEEMTIEVVNNWSTDEFKQRLSSHWPGISAFLSIEEHELIVSEGLEDDQILEIKHLKGKLHYLLCQYNFRRCAIRFTIAKQELHLVQSLHDYYNEEEINAEYVAIEIYARIYFTVSMEYNPTERIIEGLTVQEVSFRQ